MIDSVDIFGFRVNYGKSDAALDSIKSLIARKESAGIAFMNSHMIYEAHHDQLLIEGLRRFKYIFPDGMPLRRAVSMVRNLKTDRIAGNDMIFFLLDLASRRNLKVTFYGGSQSLLDKIRSKMVFEYKEVKTQYISPPFRVLTKTEEQAYFDEIASFEPDMVLIGLGCPKQEKWISVNIDKLQAPMFGLGGAFALFAGVDTRAPRWMRNMSLEWLYRLALEPRRLWKRYLVTNSYFIYLLLREFWRIRIMGKK